MKELRSSNYINKKGGQFITVTFTPEQAAKYAKGDKGTAAEVKRLVAEEVRTLPSPVKTTQVA